MIFNMEEENFSGVKVDEILADFFVRKYDGKLEESRSGSVSSNHSTGSVKESSKKSKKKKKKHKSKKSKHKHSNKRASRSPKHKEKHRSRSSDSCDWDRSRSPKRSRRHRSRTPRSRSHRSRSPQHSRRHRHKSPQNSHRSRSPRHSSKYRSSSGSHSDRSISSRHSRKYRSKSTSHSRHSSRSRSPRQKRNYSRTSSHDRKSPEKSRSKGMDNTSKCRKEEKSQTKDEKHSKQKECLPEKDVKPVSPEHCKSNDLTKSVVDLPPSLPSNNSSGVTAEISDDCSLPKLPDYTLSNAAGAEISIRIKTEDSSSFSETLTGGKGVCKATDSVIQLSDDKNNKNCYVEEKSLGVICDTKIELGKCEESQENFSLNTERKFDETVLDKSIISINKLPESNNVGDAKVALQADPTQTKAKIVIKNLKCSSLVKTLICDDIELPPDNKSSINSDDVLGSTDNDKESEERSKERCRSPSESSDKSSDSDRKSSPQEKKKRKHSKDKKHKRNKEKKHKKKKKSHSRERSASPRKIEGRGKFDKVKLLNVARRNVLSMLEKGTLPEGISLENLRHEQLISIKAGGKSVQELTEFCQALSKKEGDNNDDDDDSSKEDAKNDDDSDQPFIHHPFKLKEQSVITMNIKNATQLPVKTHAEKVAENARLSLQFPVSSGSQHRQKEMEWVPVEKDSIKTPPITEKKVASKPLLKDGKVAAENVVVPAAVTQTAASAVLITDTATVTPPPPPPPPQIPASLPPPPPPPPPPSLSFPSSSVMPTSYPVTGQFLPCETNLAINVPHVSSQRPSQMLQSPAIQNLTTYTMASSYVPTVPPPAPVVNIFPALSAKNIDLSAVVADRLKAVRKLQENPNDPEGLSILHQSEQKLQVWVQSQQVPGKFTGSTDAKLLSARELSGPNPMWARKQALKFTCCLSLCPQLMFSFPTMLSSDKMRRQRTLI